MQEILNFIMSPEYIPYHIVAGLMYVLINALRNLDTEGNYFLVLVWIFGWPIFAGIHLVRGIKKLFNRVMFS